MASHTIKVTGVSDELLQLLDERAQALRSSGRSEYIRGLIRRDVLAATLDGTSPRCRTFREILAPVHEETMRKGVSEDEMDHDIEVAIRESRTDRRTAGAV